VRVVALLAVRNEERYLQRCLEHLYRQEIETCVVDNGSTDRSLEIAESYLNRGVIRIEHLPFTGAFELVTQLLCKERLAAEIDADWFIHHDADEIREAPTPYKTLRQGIGVVDARGYNAIDFDEFVFTPTSDSESFDECDYVHEMRYYYYFEPDSPDRYRINAWKKHPNLDLHTLGGHKAIFPGMRISPEPFILRHYMVLSRAHAIEKYAGRPFSPAEKANSWHGDRASFRADEFRFPPKDRLKKLESSDEFDKSEPWHRHPIFFRPSSRKARVISDRAQRLVALKKFKGDESESIPTIDPVPDGVERPFWSVMIPIYNGQESYLVQAIESVLAQDPGSAEMQIEVVDDGTTAFDAEGVVHRIGKGRVAFYRHRENLGLTQNWNSCLRRARGFWVHLLHQDDRVLNGFYERLRGRCLQDANIAAAFCRGSGMNPAGKTTWVQEPERETPGVLANFIAREAATNRIVAPSIIIRRAVYEEIGGFHNGMPYCADWDMYKRVSVYGAIWYEPQCLASWRQHDGSATANLKTNAADLLDRMKSVALSKAYLPANIEDNTASAAQKSSLVWAAETLRDSLMHDDLTTARAQTEEILRALQHLLPGIEAKGTLEPSASSSDSARLQAQVDALEAQVQAWMRAAEAIRAKFDPTSKCEEREIR